MGLAQLRQGEGELSLDLDRVAVDHADAGDGQAAGTAHVVEADLFRARDGDDRAARRLREQEGERVEPVRYDQTRAPAAQQRRLDDRLGQTAVGQVVRGVDHAVAGGGDQDLAEQALALQVDLRGQAAEVVVDHLGPGRAAELLTRVAQQVQQLAVLLEGDRRAPGHVVDDAEDRDHRGGVDGGLAGLVVERDVAARDRGAQLQAAVGQAAHGLRELPHDRRVLRRAEVQAVGDRQRLRARRGHVAVGLRQGELRARVRVELGVAAVAVGGDGDAEAGLLVHADHARVLGLGEDGVALHEVVVLLGDPLLGRLVGRADQLEDLVLQLLARPGPGQLVGVVGLEGVLPVRTGVGALVDRAVVGDGARVDVDDLAAVPEDLQPVAVGHLADDGGDDVPLVADLEEAVDLLRLDHRAHALLRLAHEDFLGRERRVAQRDVVQRDAHAAGAVRRQFAGRAGQARRSQVLDADDQLLGEGLQGALDEELLLEGVADLDGGALGRLGVVEGLGGQDRGAADAVAAGAGAVQDDLVARAGRLGEVDVLVPHDADGTGVDQRVALVAGVEDDLAADVGQAQAVAVAADAGDDAGQDALGVGVVGGAEAQGVDHGHRAGAHRDDVAHDAADARGRALVGLHVGRVVVRLDLEGDRVALADVDDTGVLADADEQGVGPGGLLAELAQVHLAALVRAVLGPHHGVHGQLRAGGAAAEDLHDPLVLVLLQAQLGPGQLDVGGRGRVLDRVQRRPAHALTSFLRIEVKNGRPSVRPVPISGSTACSGCGMRPTTFPAALVMPAMSLSEPLGFMSR